MSKDRVPWIDPKQAGRAGVVSSANDASGRASGRRCDGAQIPPDPASVRPLIRWRVGWESINGSFLDIFLSHGTQSRGFRQFFGPYKGGG